MTFQSLMYHLPREAPKQSHDVFAAALQIVIDDLINIFVHDVFTTAHINRVNVHNNTDSCFNSNHSVWSSSPERCWPRPEKSINNFWKHLCTNYSLYNMICCCHFILRMLTILHYCVAVYPIYTISLIIHLTVPLNAHVFIRQVSQGQQIVWLNWVLVVDINLHLCSRTRRETPIIAGTEQCSPVFRIPDTSVQ